MDEIPYKPPFVGDFPLLYLITGGYPQYANSVVSRMVSQTPTSAASTGVFDTLPSGIMRSSHKSTMKLGAPCTAPKVPTLRTVSMTQIPVTDGLKIIEKIRFGRNNTGFKEPNMGFKDGCRE